MSSQDERGERFRALHEGEPFVIPNPWDVGSARVLEGLGFQALATTSSAFAFTLGRSDGQVTLDELAAHVTVLTAATDLPVSVDLENKGVRVDGWFSRQEAVDEIHASRARFRESSAH